MLLANCSAEGRDKTGRGVEPAIRGAIAAGQRNVVKVAVEDHVAEPRAVLLTDR